MSALLGYGITQAKLRWGTNKGKTFTTILEHVAFDGLTLSACYWPALAT
jgi:hypothetical protein